MHLFSNELSLNHKTLHWLLGIQFHKPTQIYLYFSDLAGETCGWIFYPHSAMTAGAPQINLITFSHREFQLLNVKFSGFSIPIHITPEISPHFQVELHVSIHSPLVSNRLGRGDYKLSKLTHASQARRDIQWVLAKLLGLLPAGWVQKTSKGHPDQVHEPPKLAPFKVKEQWLASELLSLSLRLNLIIKCSLDKYQSWECGHEPRSAADIYQLF